MLLFYLFIFVSGTLVKLKIQTENLSVLKVQNKKIHRYIYKIKPSR